MKQSLLSFLFFNKIFCLFTCKMRPPSQLSFQKSSLHPLPQPVSGYPTHTPNDPSLGNPSEASLFYICVVALDQLIYALWFMAQALGGTSVSRYMICWFSYGVTICFSSFNPSSNYSIKVHKLSPNVLCKGLHLSQSADSQRTSMLGSI